MCVCVCVCVCERVQVCVGGRSKVGQARLIVGDVNFIRHMQIDVNFN